MTKLKNPEKADLNKDDRLSSYEETRGQAVEKNMAKQNRAKLKSGGIIANGCGAVMKNRRKVTTIRQEKNMPKKKSNVDPKLQARLDAKVRPDAPVSDERIILDAKGNVVKQKKKAAAKKTTKKTTKKK